MNFDYFKLLSMVQSPWTGLLRKNSIYRDWIHQDCTVWRNWLSAFQIQWAFLFFVRERSLLLSLLKSKLMRCMQYASAHSMWADFCCCINFFHLPRLWWLLICDVNMRRDANRHQLVLFIFVVSVNELVMGSRSHRLSVAAFFSSLFASQYSASSSAVWVCARYSSLNTCCSWCVLWIRQHVRTRQYDR